MNPATNVLLEGIRKSLTEAEVAIDAHANLADIIKVGDIFVVSWGYDQTNINFFEVIALKGKMAVVRGIEKKRVGTQGTSNVVVPAPGHYVTWGWGEQPKRVRPKMNCYKGAACFKTDYGTAYKWDGEAEHETMAEFGH
jgi:hypothetical protein